ncbi:hypothetical protein AB0J47_13580 [Nocardia sp. NPDC049737]|uniref:hypothetical protein n=1 Tax=Nocardia sp. NPDC049737 TaxID=3154358 RepID=UPI0034325B9F
MPDEYDAIRSELSNYEKGLYFELGRAHIRGETPEKGWVRQFKIETGKGARILDSARTEGRGTRGVERKSGRVNERDAREQLQKERAGLDSRQLTHSTWETVEGEKVPDKVREDMHALERDFPGRFRHEIVSRADAARAIRLGQSLVSQQLELIRAYELVRADRARKRLGKIRELVRAREAKAKDERAQEKEPQQRGITKERDEQVRENKARDERARVEPEPATRVVRELPTWAQILTREDNRNNAQPPTRADRDAQTVEMPSLEIKPGRAQEPPAPPPAPQRTPEQEHENSRARAIQERNNARALARENGLSPQIMGILGLNSNEPPKMINVDQARAHAESERDRSIHQQRERERAEREREGRHRGE